jgi:hypothetical protein
MLWFVVCCVVLLSMLVFLLVVAVSTFGQRTGRRYNNTHCTYGVNLQHEGSISELHCAKSFFSRAREDRTIFLQRIICTAVEHETTGVAGNPLRFKNSALRAPNGS